MQLDPGTGSGVEGITKENFEMRDKAMWTRAELKDKAKASLKQNYWKCVIVGLILGILLNSGSYSAGRSAKQEAKEAGISFANVSPEALAAVIGGVFAIMGVMLIINILLTIFVWNPLEVGCERFFVKSHEEETTDIKEVLFSFKNGYGHIGGILFIRDIFIALWSLLLIVPGIVKSYEYMMIPYLLAEDPSMSREEAFAKSKAMMAGNKWNAFVLDLSFIGWLILGCITLNLVNIFYVNPYMYLTRAELYRTLRDAQ